MPSLRKKIPSRSFTKKYSSCRLYKEPLRKDFNRRCGYCDDLDCYCGGQRGYHMDHFRPKTEFRDLEYNYTNLVYSCPYCNETKSDDWPAGDSPETFIGDKGYIDPCLKEYDDHLVRCVDVGEDYGLIKPVTPLGQYMFKNLNLGLKRHQLMYMLTEVKELLKQVLSVLKKNEYNSELLRKHFKLTEQYVALQDQLEEII